MYNYKLNKYLDKIDKLFKSMHGGVACDNKCGRSTNGKFNTCCQACATGTHTAACDVRFLATASKCKNNCGRYENHPYPICCPKCASGTHTPLCDVRQQSIISTASISTPSVVTLNGGSVHIDFTLPETGPVHMTICFITPGATISQKCYDELKDYYNNIVVNINPTQQLHFQNAWWNPARPASVLLKVGSDIEQLQYMIFNDILTILTATTCSAINILNTSRYPTGKPLAHVDIKGNNAALIKYSNAPTNVRIKFNFKALNL